MQKTRDAVAYAMDTLKVSSEVLFTLIKNSNGYDGDDYPRWLAAQIIKIAEAEEIGFSQLLIRKFDILTMLEEEASGGEVLSSKALRVCKSLCGSDKMIYTIGVPELGMPIDDVDWFSGVDLTAENRIFTDGLSEELQEVVLEGEGTIFARLSGEAADKKSDLFLDAKQRGITCSTEGALMLHRFNTMAATVLSDSFKLGVIAPVSFFYNPENSGVVAEFVDHFHYKGYVIRSQDMYLGVYGGSYAVIVATPRKLEEEMQDGVLLYPVSFSNKEPIKGSKALRFSPSIMKTQSSVLLDTAPAVNNLETKDIFGYLSLGNGAMLVSDLPVDARRVVPITKSNFLDAILYYGVFHSRSEFGLFKDPPVLMDGHPSYKDLFFNCIPLALYGSDMKLSCQQWTGMHRALQGGEAYYGYEAKELLSWCSSTVDCLREADKYDDSLSFGELRVLLESQDLDNTYFTCLKKLQNFVGQLYKKMV